jgi:L-ascorbate metabolism protein UlaG (beta-lactamase superfamily)
MTALTITKRGHSCLQVSHEGGTLVIDPGVFSDPDALDGADALLITHEHVDHVDEPVVRAALAANPALHVWTNASVAAMLDGLGTRVTVVGHGDTFTAAGVAVEAHGELHAVIHPDIPRVRNVGYLLEGRVFHPGDALTVPDRPVETLMLPVHAPWNKISEVIDYVRAVGPGIAYSIHETLLSPPGLALVGRLLGEGGPGVGTATYRHLPSGDAFRS